LARVREIEARLWLRRGDTLKVRERFNEAVALSERALTLDSQREIDRNYPARLRRELSDLMKP